jgi:hypothetical protein
MLPRLCGLHIDEWPVHFVEPAIALLSRGAKVPK